MTGLIIALAFLSGFLFVWITACAWSDTRRRRRLLKSLKQTKNLDVRKPAGATQLQNLLRVLGSRKNKTESKEDLRENETLHRAGFRHPEGRVFYRGIRVVCLVIFALLGVVYTLLCRQMDTRAVMEIYALGVIGFFLPKAALCWLSGRREHRVFRELPDVLDVVLICVNAGLTFDQALRRVEQELDFVAPVLGKELRRYLVEVGSGLPRRQALENLSRRNAMDCLSSVVNVLIQSARYGTDISAALRRMAESLREERRLKAEEKAATVSTKLVFPTILFIMPALMLIVLGPAIIQVAKQLNKIF